MRRMTNNVTFHNKQVLTDGPDVAGCLPGDGKLSSRKLKFSVGLYRMRRVTKFCKVKPLSNFPEAQISIFIFLMENQTCLRFSKNQLAV